jgi:carbamoyl-phosphate synthase/aspartate carbamoyltransferase/dihydroorotase
MLKLPGLIDVHVHLREPGATHKEDWESGTSAAIAGGVTMVLAMPNTKPPVTDEITLDVTLALAKTKARCDYAQFLGAGPDNTDWQPELANRSAGLKMYLDQTYGPLRLDEMTLWMEHFERWPKHMPVVAHAESRSLAAVILMAELFDRSIHLAHVSLAEEILLIRKAKERGLKVTCEVAPHHLFLTKEDIGKMATSGRGEVRPVLASRTDQETLWQNLDVIDCFATDHAPHTLAEKDSKTPPPGFPGLETILPLLLTGVHAGRLTIDDIVMKMGDNPRRIFNLPEQKNTWIEVDPDEQFEIHASKMFTRCAWTPFEGMPVYGRLERVVLHGTVVYQDGSVLATPGFGQDIRENSN